MQGMDGTERIAADVAGWRRDGRRTEGPPGVRDLDQALAIQDRAAALIGSAPVGWKVGGTDAAVRQRLGLDGPFSGRIFADRLWPSGATVAARAGQVFVECEIAVRLKADVPPGSDVTAAIGAWHLAFEVVDCAWRRRDLLRGFDFLADNGGCGGMVLGAAVDLPPDAQRIDLRLEQEGRMVKQAMVRDLRARALDNAAQLAAHLAPRGIALRAGDYILTGTLNGLNDVTDARHVRGVFGTLGTVEAHLPAGRAA